jgi:hypothetical protein
LVICGGNSPSFNISDNPEVITLDEIQNGVDSWTFWLLSDEITVTERSFLLLTVLPSRAACSSVSTTLITG